MDLSKLFNVGIDKVVNSVGDGLNDLFTSDDERLQAKNMLAQIQSEMQKHSQTLNLEMEREITKRADAQKSVIIAEATGESMAQRNWRPWTMLTFTFIIANFYIFDPFLNILFNIDVEAKELDPELWSLLKIGMGGYIGALGAKQVIESSKWSK